jgi:hypothetical protein
VNSMGGNQHAARRMKVNAPSRGGLTRCLLGWRMVVKEIEGNR